MSGNKDRIAIFPSRANLVFVKQRIAGAHKGLSLLKRKRDALELHLRQIAADLNQNREQSETILREAIFSLAKAKFLGTDFRPATVANPDRADAYLRLKNTKYVGIQVPTLELMLKRSNALHFTGLSSGGQQVQVIREKFQAALKILVAVASLEYSYKIINEAVKQNNKRVNGLEYVVLPRYQNTAIYIRDELDEFEREDFYRLKRSQAKQTKKKSDFVKEMAERERVKFIEDHPDYDFKDMGIIIPHHKSLAFIPKTKLLPGKRKTIVQAMDNKVVIETEDAKPLNLDAVFSKAVIKDPNALKKKKQHFLSSSSSEEEEEEEEEDEDEEESEN